jgi:hypothetical protein
VLKIHPDELMALLTFEVKFPYITQFLFRSLMFTTGEDRTLELLTQGPAPSHYEPIYGEASYYPADPSTSSAPNDTCLGLNPYAGTYYLSATTS